MGGVFWTSYYRWLSRADCDDHTVTDTTVGISLHKGNGEVEPCPVFVPTGLLLIFQVPVQLCMFEKPLPFIMILPPSSPMAPSLSLGLRYSLSLTLLHEVTE